MFTIMLYQMLRNSYNSRLQDGGMRPSIEQPRFQPLMYSLIRVGTEHIQSFALYKHISHHVHLAPR